jgi:FkbM family methyltransferase
MSNNIVKNIVRKIIPSKYRSSIIKSFVGYSVKSYSQEGEDMLLKRLYENLDYKGFYVDIGAHHPLRFSNTYYFYKRGWSGINVDAMPGSMKAFDSKRSRDINLELPVSREKEILTYFAFEEPALNTFSEDNAKSIMNDKQSQLLFKKEIETVTLEEIFDKYLKDRKIDFLTIDVEGLDFQVLQSNNWNKYTPSVIVIEAYATNINDILESDIYKYLVALGYALIAKTPNTAIYKYKN